jgi:hypothetical protein
MSLNRRFQALAICIPLSFIPTPSSALESRLLAQTQDIPRVEILSHKIVGHSSGIPVKIDLARTIGGPNSKLKVTVKFGNDFVRNFSLPLKTIPQLDLSSASYFARSGGKRIVVIRMRFSTKKDCFVNDDGRDQLAITFEDGRNPEVHTISYVDCEPQLDFLQN